MTEYSLTRYLYARDEVELSFIASLISGKDIEECYYRGYELYYSGYDVFRTIWKVYYDFYYEYNLVWNPLSEPRNDCGEKIRNRTTLR